MRLVCQVELSLVRLVSNTGVRPSPGNATRIIVRSILELVLLQPEGLAESSRGSSSETPGSRSPFLCTPKGVPDSHRSLQILRVIFYSVLLEQNFQFIFK